MPASRIVVNSPSTHGAIGFTTDLEPSMTLGCGSWGGNVTSDNISPKHLIDIKRIAFETRPINRAAATTQPSVARPAASVDRAEIAAMVDRFLAERRVNQPAQSTPPAVSAPAPTQTQPSPQRTAPMPASTNGTTNGRVYDFV